MRKMSKINHLIMIANAMNNYNHMPARLVVCPTREVAETITRLMGERGVTAMTVADYQKSALQTAMATYKDKTDWRAFSRNDWTAAWAWLDRASTAELIA